MYCLVNEAFGAFSKNGIIDGKAIKLLQELLFSLGFPNSAKKLFLAWKAQQEAEAAAAAAAAAEASSGKKEDKKSKKDDKKDKKDDKKDKKDDKKDKKDKKDEKDDKAEKGPDEYKVKKGDILWSGVGSDEYLFQMTHLGPYMTRTVGNKKDPKERVMFKPEEIRSNLLVFVFQSLLHNAVKHVSVDSTIIHVRCIKTAGCI